ncbi:MAG: hypothetical protein IJD64_05135 [Clostridia bacterium]|nr:hypothetical protein [Clostridia bacterium]
MKKFIAFFLCLMMILSLVSCELNEAQDTLSQNENSDSDSVDGDHTSAQISDNETAMQTYPITAEQAWNLANAYWDNQDGRKEHSAGTIFTAKIVLIDTPNSETDHYRFAFQVEWNSGGGMDGYESMPPYHINTHDQILVNAFTGEITASTYDPNGKGIPVEEAIEIAKNDCEYMDFENEENEYRVRHTVNVPSPEHIYVIVIEKYVVDHYSYSTERWVDKYTGEIVVPYYLHGKG